MTARGLATRFLVARTGFATVIRLLIARPPHSPAAPLRLPWRRAPSRDRCAPDPARSRRRPAVQLRRQASASATPSCTSRSRNHSRRLSLKAIAILSTACLPRPSSATALTNGTAAKILGGKPPLQRIEGAEDLFGGRFVGGARLHEAALQIGRDQRILGREMVVERALADADFGGDGIDADGANALQIEQAGPRSRRIRSFMVGLSDRQALLHRPVLFALDSGVAL